MFTIVLFIIGCNNPKGPLTLYGEVTPITDDADDSATPDSTTECDTAGDSTPGTSANTRAVFQGWMTSHGVQEGNPGNTFLFGDWTFHLESLDGEAHSVIVTPTTFAFALDANNDHRFGIDGNDVVAGDIVHFCWLLYSDSYNGIAVADDDIGGPELNTMAGGYPSFTVRSGNDITIGLMCNTFDFAPTGVKIAASIDYDVEGDNTFDASVADLANTGILPQYYVRID